MSVPSAHSRSSRRQGKRTIPHASTIYQLRSSADGQGGSDPGFIPLTSDANRPDWGNYPAIRAVLQKGGLDAAGWYGFLPADFGTLTRLTANNVVQYLATLDKNIEVALFSPLADQQALFASTVEQGEYAYPGLSSCMEDLYAALGLSPVGRTVMDSRSTVLRDCFVAKPRFWRAWLQINEKIFAIAEGRDSPLKERLNTLVADGPQGAPVAMKTLVLERTASILLATQKGWKTAAHHAFRLPFTKGTPSLGDLGIVDAAALDALKIAYRDHGLLEYLATFIAARRRFFLGRQPPFDLQALLPSANPAKIATPSPRPRQDLLVADGSDGDKRLSLVELISRTEELTVSARQEDAIRLYQNWLQGTESPHAYVAHFNLGYLLAGQGELQPALEAYQAALAQNPKFPQARLNLGSVLERLGRKDEALAVWHQTLADLEPVSPTDTPFAVHALNSMGRLSEELHRFPEAEAALTRSLTLKPEQDDALLHWVHLRQKQCNWPVYQSLPGIGVERMVQATSALAMLSASNDPSLQLNAARNFVDKKVKQGLLSLAPASGYGHERLRIGYLSSNFGMHAVSLLTAELYELHDRSRVEVFGFCWSPEDNSPMRARVRQAMDHFVLIGRMTDEEAAQAIRDAEIDILVDLQGLTSGCRANILSHRPAPVQITYLGFPGPTALPGIDYVLADEYVLPPELAAHFIEKPLYLPECFQVNDRKRAAAAVPPRSKYGLPEDALVYCAFNHNHKFTPELYSVWLSILRRTPGSLLWLLADNERARENLLRHAVEQGIESERLVFAPRVSAMEYLARFQLADLFLDTFPFNGGTTASDALWMGLPVITCSGATFASRMAGSLLHAIGAPELITTSFADYEELAVDLATDRTRLASVRKRIEANRATHPLFDTPRFVRALENIFEEVAARP